MSDKVTLALSIPERDAVLAGLSILSDMIKTASVPGLAFEILTENEGPPSPEEIEALSDRINSTDD